MTRLNYFTLWISKYPTIKIFLKKIYILFGIKKYLNYKKEKPLRNYGEEALINAKKALDSINKFFWLDFGTLLGSYRDNGFIKGDTDIDISIFLEDYSPEIDKAMLDAGFTKFSQIEIDDGNYGLEQTYEYNGLHIDIFYYTMADDKMYTHSFMPFPGYNSYSESYLKTGGLQPIEQYLPFYGFKKIKYLNTTFNIPKKVEEHLSFHYGSDFMTPRKWDFTNLEADNINAKFLLNKIGKVTQINNQ